MSAFYEMVLTEIERLDKEIKHYETVMEPLQKGTTRVVDDKYLYFYSYDKEKGVTTTKYIGHKDSKKALEINQQLRLQKYYEELLKLLKAQKDEMEAYERAGRKYNKTKEESKDKDKKSKTKLIKAKKTGKKKKQSKVKEEDYELE